MKITGVPGLKNIVMLFDPNDIEKVSAYKWRELVLHLIAIIRLLFSSAVVMLKVKKPLVHHRTSEQLFCFLREYFRDFITISNWDNKISGNVFKFI
jgi:hypothetical protein